MSAESVAAFDSEKASVKVIDDEPKSASSEFVARTILAGRTCRRMCQDEFQRNADSWTFTILTSWLLQRIVSSTMDVNLDKSQPTDVNDEVS